MHNSGKMSPNGIASLTWFSIECKCFTMQCLMMAHTNEQLNLNCQTVQVGRMFIEQLASFHLMHKISISFLLCNHLYLPWPIKENVFRLFQNISALVCLLPLPLQQEANYGKPARSPYELCSTMQQQKEESQLCRRMPKHSAMQSNAMLRPRLPYKS